MSDRVMLKTAFAAICVAATLTLAAHRSAAQTCNGNSPAYGGYYTYSYPGGYYVYNGAYYGYTSPYGPIATYRNWGGPIYDPVTPNDWGQGALGPRHNLNSSQHHPSGYQVRW
jgi:hypothetical protein